MTEETLDDVPQLDLTSERDGADRVADSDTESTHDGSMGSNNASDRSEPGETEPMSNGDGGSAVNGDDGSASNEDSEPSMNGDDPVPITVDIEAPEGTDADAVEPVELLVQLAEDGEIEPWDIDIVQVTDAFLDRLDETDLRTTGRALFYASVLLRMKSDELIASDDDDDEPEAEPWELAMEGGGVDHAEPGFDPIDQLEAEMERRLDRKHTRGSPETLDELVRDLREAERDSWWKRSREYDTTGSPRGYDRGTQTLDYHTGDEFRRDGEPTAGEATERTHDEDIEAVIDDVEASIRPHFEQGRAEVLFAEVQAAGGRPFMTFLALLFMAHRGSVRLQQDELFGDLWIRDPTALTVETEAVAD